MMKRSILTKAVLLAGGIALSGIAQASGSEVIDDNMTRRAPGSASGSGDTVEANCPIDPSGNAWQGATAKLEISQKGSTSEVEIEVEGAVPNTLYTVWLRIQGKNGLNPAGSPLTGGGATPLAPGTALDDLNAISPWAPLPGGAGATSSANSFTTDATGFAEAEFDLDFPVVRGAYPFQMTATSRPGHALHANVPTAIADPREPGQAGTPFLIRVVSHCKDQLSHGLSPYVREAWFQYP